MLLSRLCAWLGPVVLAPDVKHENRGDEEEGHHQDGDRANLDSRRIVGVEPPHAAAAGAAGAPTGARSCGCEHGWCCMQFMDSA
jgi:hypothetical protein